jgi:hypothetical protein
MSVENPPVNQGKPQLDYFHNWWKYSSTSRERENVLKAIIENINPGVYRGRDFRATVSHAIDLYCHNSWFKKKSVTRSMNHKTKLIYLKLIINIKFFSKALILSLYQINNSLEKFKSEIKAEIIIKLILT